MLKVGEQIMNYTWLFILTILTMVAALILTVRVGSTINKKGTDSTYVRNMGRKWGRLIALYIAGTIIVLVIFLYMMD
jgi:uncharacterized membrane protein